MIGKPNKHVEEVHIFSQLHVMSNVSDRRFFSLVNQTIDGPEFTELHQYSPEVMKNFVFIILTTNNNVPENLVNNTITVKVV